MNLKHQRSVLYNIPPIGVGTMEVESLTSYIARIADAHCVETGALINEILINEIKKERIYKEETVSAVYRNDTHKFNGLSVAAAENVTIMNKLCGREDIESLTLIKYKNVLNHNKLLKKNKSWCPYCIADMKEIQFEKLIWCITPVDICHIHSTKLEDTCRKCGANQKHLKFKTLNGFCQKCFQWLGCNEKVCAERKLNPQKVVFIGKMLEESSTREIFTNNHMIENLTNLWKSIPRPKREFLESQIGIGGKLISDLQRGIKDKISLRNLIHLCAYLDCPANDLFGKLINISLESLKPNEIPSINNTREKVDKEKLEKKLIRYLDLCREDENNYLSIKELEKKFGHATSTIIKYFPVLFEEIKKQNVISREKLKILKEKEKLALIRGETIKLYHSGIYPSLRKVHNKLPFVITGFENEYRDMWEATIIELGILRRVNQFG